MKARQMDAIGLAHDIRNCLQMIRSAAGLLENGSDDANKRKTYFETIRKNVAYAMELLNRFMEHGTLERAPRVAGSISDILQEVCASFEAYAENNGVCLDCDADELLPEVADAEALRRALFNLLCNAVRCTPSEGYVHAAAKQLDNCCVVLVSDTGFGLPEGRREAFLEGKVRAGTGLHVVRRMAKELGAQVDCISEAGKGTTFALYFENLPKDIGAPCAQKNTAAASV